MCDLWTEMRGTFGSTLSIHKKMTKHSHADLKVMQKLFDVYDSFDILSLQYPDWTVDPNFFLSILEW